MSPRHLAWTVDGEAAGVRLDAFLAGRESALTRSGWKRVIEEGGVTVGGRVAARPGLMLKAGAEVGAMLPDPAPTELTGEDIPLTIVYEDDHLAVIDKPAGIVVHPGHGATRGTLVHALLGARMPLAPAGGGVRPGIVHRLDKDTSGLLVVAKTDVAHRGLTAAFARREMEKTYVAFIWRRIRPAAGTIEETIGRSRRDPTKMAIGTPNGRAATTIYETIEELPGCAVLSIRLVTGRTHQIRVHLSSLGHPVLGDTRYGGAPWKSARDVALRETLGALHRLGLHAKHLRFAHPVTGAALSLEAPLPAELVSLLEYLRRRRP